MRNTCIIGVRGVGKTSIISNLINMNTDYHFITGSEMIKKVSGSDYKIFNTLSDLKKEQYRSESINQLIKLKNKIEKKLVVDGHLSFYNKELGIIENIYTMPDIEFFDNYILLHPTAELVKKRRVNDVNKKRELDVKIISLEIESEYNLAHIIAKEYSKKLEVIQINFSTTDIENSILLALRNFEVLK